MKHILPLLCLLALAMGALSCSDNSCFDNGNCLPLARFYMSGSEKNVTISDVTLKGVGAPNDSAISKNKSMNEAFLPLRATMNSTQWVIEVAITNGSTVSDTITLDYKSTPYFASAECGAMFSFELSNVVTTHHIIDSVAITQKNVTNVKAENLRIYFAN